MNNIQRSTEKLLLLSIGLASLCNGLIVYAKSVSDDEFIMEEVIVTATRRQGCERLQK